MTDLQEMSDYLAEHLLGWTMQDRTPTLITFHEWWWGTPEMDLVVRFDLWHPHTDIAQCFEYIVPAMTKTGWQLSLDVGETSSSAMWWRPVRFPAPFKLQHSLPSAALVEAAYQAIKEQK